MRGHRGHVDIQMCPTHACYTFSMEPFRISDKRVAQRVALLVALCSLAGIAYFSMNLRVSVASTGTPCHTIVGNAVGGTSQNYASPVDFFGSPGTMLMTAVCSGKTATAHIGTGSYTQYIYKNGYEYVDGSWKRITFSGADNTGPWIVGRASAPLTISKNSTKGKVLAYICQNVRGTWKCGCKDTACARPYWKLQEFDTKSTPTPSQEVTPEMLLEVVDDTYLIVYGATSTMVASKVTPGKKLLFSGEGFGSGIEVHFGTSATVPARTLNSRTLELTVPNVAPGVYKIWFTQGKKRSKNITFIVNNENPRPIKILSVSPTVLENNSRVTVQGEGFTPTGNLVYVSAFAFHNLPSPDGKTITFTLKPEKLSEHDIAQEARAFLTKEMITQVQNLDQIYSTGQTVKMSLQIINANGISGVHYVWFK